MACDRWREVQTPVGPLKMLLPPIDFERVEARMNCLPAVGEQTGQILAALGYTAEQIEQLQAAGLI
ncbi:MAG: hypothetical protein IMW90_20325 [Thermogemmatispora sp.]|jgi:itaconate CoA-transferase|uniref:hypothetical protein n=1 Tax=Thermogemmatispora sp. TaxID=1968838 RepID=UPI0019DE2D34|nr:hypothetical protein [Thermogemmatispora sp.]MBE3568070.1 hypothetical protein [Thermogemmatispora sp.]